MGNTKSIFFFQLALPVKQLKPYIGEKKKNLRDLFLLTISGVFTLCLEKTLTVKYITHYLTLLSMALIVIIWLIFNLFVLNKILKKLEKNLCIC